MKSKYIFLLGFAFLLSGLSAVNLNNYKKLHITKENSQTAPFSTSLKNSIQEPMSAQNTYYYGNVSSLTDKNIKTGSFGLVKSQTTNDSNKPENIIFTPAPLPDPLPTVFRFPQPSPTISPDNSDSCLSTGGVWREFPTSCADQCGLPTTPSDRICLTVMTTACDCGPNACWNGSKCIPDDSQPIITIAPTPTTAPTCGNGICELGEADLIDCPICTDDRICPLMPCYIKPGTCPKDCPVTPVEF